GVSQFREPRLESRHREQVENAITLLRPRDVALSNELQKLYGPRLLQMEKLFTLEKPYKRLRDVFDPDRTRVTVEGNGLTAAGREVLTRVPSAGVMKVEATFDPSWQSGTHLGLLLNAAQEGNRIVGYGLVLLAAKNPTPGG